MRLVLALPLAFCLIVIGGSVYPQEKISIHTINTTDAPRIRIRVSSTPSDLLPPGTRFTVLENGVPVSATVTCDDTTTTRYIVFCLDRSGSITPFLPQIKKAANSVVDILRSNDSAGLVVFSSFAGMMHPLSTNRITLTAAINSIAPVGGTALYDAVALSAKILQGKQGDRFIVALSDGQDNTSRISVDSAAKTVIAANAVLLCIPFGVSLSEMKDLSEKSNGLYVAAADSAALDSAFASISRFLSTRFCNLEYLAADCRDSVKTVTVIAETGSRQFRADSLFVLPTSADSLHLRVVLPPGMKPGQTDTVRFYVEGKLPSTPLQFCLRLRYPKSSATLSAAPLNLPGAIVDPAGIAVMNLPGDTIAVFGKDLSAKTPNGLFCAFSITAAAGDFSRVVPIVIDSVFFAQNCVIKIAYSIDTTRVCSCIQSYGAVKGRTGIVRGDGTVALPLWIDNVNDASRSFEFIADLRYDTTRFRFLGAEWSDDQRFETALTARTAGPGILTVAGRNEAKQSGNPTRLVILRFETMLAQGFSPAYHYITVENFRYYSTCCPEKPVADSLAVLVDGNCDKIVRKKSIAVSTFPNPAVDGHHVRIALATESRVRVELYTMNGAFQGLVYEGPVSGSLSLRKEFTDLQAGCYYYLVRADAGATVTTPFVVLK